MRWLEMARSGTRMMSLTPGHVVGDVLQRMHNSGQHRLGVARPAAGHGNRPRLLPVNGVQRRWRCRLPSAACCAADVSAPLPRPANAMNVYRPWKQAARELHRCADCCMRACHKRGQAVHAPVPVARHGQAPRGAMTALRLLLLLASRGQPLLVLRAPIPLCRRPVLEELREAHKELAQGLPPVLRMHRGPPRCMHSACSVLRSAPAQQGLSGKVCRRCTQLGRGRCGQEQHTLASRPCACSYSLNSQLSSASSLWCSLQGMARQGRAALDGVRGSSVCRHSLWQ